MKLTTKGRFAVTAMIDVALFNHEGPVTLAEVSARQKISLSYLEQLFGKLRRHGLVDSVRGPGGGYNLAKAPGTISVSDIIWRLMSLSTPQVAVAKKIVTMTAFASPIICGQASTRTSSPIFRA